LPRASFISSLDLKDAFWQILLERSSREKTAFTVPGRPLYYFTVMPFGFCNAPQTMSKLMDKVIPYWLREKVFVYLDGLLVVSENFDEHLAELSKLMDKVIPYWLREKVFVYLDDPLVISENFDEHLATLREVADHLRKAGLTINIEKSKFLRRNVKYLGYVVGDGGLKLDPHKVHAIFDFPKPKSVKQVRRFLGMSGYYRRFIANYAEETEGLTNLLKKP
jgi:hypothetical protein